MADHGRLSSDSSETVDKKQALPLITKFPRIPTARRDSKSMAKPPEALTEKDLVAFDHVAAGQ
jgi:hypothetical protein